MNYRYYTLHTFGTEILKEFMHQKIDAFFVVLMTK